MSTDDRKLSVCLTFDWDAMSSWIWKGVDTYAAMARGEFGVIGMPRILDLLDKHQVKGTFFIPGHTAMAYPHVVRDIRDGGHEIGHHGFVHEDPDAFDAPGEREIYRRGVDALEHAAGVTPTGYRAPGQGNFSPQTIDILLENGVRYDSTFCAADFLPYYLRRGDRWSKTEPYEFGEPCEMVELPFSWSLDDYPHFELVIGWTYALKTPSEVREIWQSEFDYAVENFADGGIFNLTMHPEVIGRGSRMKMLDQLIGYMREHPQVTFESCGEYAERWRVEHPLDEYKAKGGPHAPHLLSR
jgi:peptidoglycan/xylan/chitin deacetylase (PgdA/CDA1 family)